MKLSLFFFLVISISCKARTQESNPSAAMRTKSMLKGTNIEVCWDQNITPIESELDTQALRNQNENPNGKKAKELIKDVIIASFKDVTKFNFVGWGTCDKSIKLQGVDDRVSIAIDTENTDVIRRFNKSIIFDYPNLKKLTYESKKKYAEENGYKIPDENDIEIFYGWIYYNISHEMFHVLGADHEAERDDFYVYWPNRTDCKRETDKSGREIIRRDQSSLNATSEDKARGLVFIGKPDPNSLSTYCRTSLDELSPGDIFGLGFLYGFPKKNEELLRRMRSIAIEDLLRIVPTDEHFPINAVEKDDADEDVMLQKKLNQLGADPQLVIDGKIGKASIAALKKYQQNAGLPVTGAFDSLTRKKLGITGIGMAKGDHILFVNMWLSQDLQSKLDFDYDSHSILFDKKMESQLKRYQIAYGISPADGTLNQATWEHVLMLHRGIVTDSLGK